MSDNTKQEKQPGVALSLGAGAYLVSNRETWEALAGPPRPSAPAEPTEMAIASRAAQVYIFNVAPWEFRAHCGSMGQYVISAAEWPTGETHIAIPGYPSEPYWDGESWVRLYHKPVHGRHTSGMDFALQVIRASCTSRRIDSAEVPTPFGAFASYIETPQGRVLTEARHAVLGAAGERIKDMVRRDQRELRNPHADYDRQCLRLINHPKTANGEFESAISAKEIDELVQAAMKDVR